MLNLFDRLFYNIKSKPIISVNKYPIFNYLPKDNITFKFPKFNPLLIPNKKEDVIDLKKDDKNPDNSIPLTVILLVIIGCFILKKKY